MFRLVSKYRGAIMRLSILWVMAFRSGVSVLERYRAVQIALRFLEVVGAFSLEVYLIHISQNALWYVVFIILAIASYAYHKGIAWTTARFSACAAQLSTVSAPLTVEHEKDAPPLPSGNYPAPSRKAYIEFLRILACFLVIVNHTAHSIFLLINPSLTWFSSLTWFFISKIAVPIFLFISGALLLKKQDMPRK